jgi:2-hydroxy-3-keto-5-methylthiopentenyl-1-phosphate phosphatase
MVNTVLIFLKEKYKSIQNKIEIYKARQVAEKVKQFMSEINNDQIPCIVISYNNGVYVQNTVEQLNKFNIFTIVIDNNSTAKNSIEILNQIDNSGKAKVIFGKYNLGHKVGFIENVYNELPNYFAYTDPDLEFNKNLPKNFLKKLSYLTNELQTYKVGFALSLLENESMCINNLEYEKKRFWRKQILHKELELFAVEIDTTFAVYNKLNYLGNFYDAVRVAGNYSAIHLPWYEKRDLFNRTDLENYLKGNISSHNGLRKFIK